MRADRASTKPLARAALALALVFSTLTVLIAASPAAAAVFSNPAPITIADAGPCGPPATPGKATPYPSTITVTGLTGTVSDVNVTLTGVTHAFQGDLEILLVGPGGTTQNLTLLSDAGTGALTNATVTFDDLAGSQAPQNVAWVPGTYKPTNYTELSGADPFPSPAPPPSANTTLALAFNGILPNGTWSLYVVDDGCGDVGSIGGWSLDITTAGGAATTTSVTSAPNPSTTGQNVAFTATVTSSGTPVTTGTVTFTEGPTVLASNVALNASGQATFSTSTLAEGNHVVTATYNGVAAFSTSNGAVNQRVNNATVVTGTSYCNTGPIAINALPNPATPYPSNIQVASAPTTVQDVNVTLKNVTHTFPDDIDVLLVGPAGQNLVLVSDAGNPGSPGLVGASNVTATFDDEAAGQLAQNTPWGPASSTVTSKPVDYDPLAQVDGFPAPAPAPSGATTLTAFDATNPNGTWSLYVVSDGAPETGTIAGGWCLDLTFDTTPPAVTINQAAGQPDPTTTGLVNFTATFSEPVTGFTDSDVSFTGSTAGGTLVANVSGSGTTYNVAVIGMTTTGTVVATIPAGSAVDAANNPNVASTSTDNTVTFRRAFLSLPGTVTGSTSWSMRFSLTTGPADATFTYGVRPPALVPLTGDWDGDGIKTPGIYQAGEFKLRNSNDAGAPEIVFAFGDPRAFPVSGDFNGDGLDDVALFRAGTWQVRITGSGVTSTFSFGAPGVWPSVVPVAGDWDGDGTDGIGLYCRDNATCPAGTWTLRNTASAGPPDAVFTYNPGAFGAYPVVGDWDRDGSDTVGVRSGTTWLLNNANDPSPPDITFDFGLANDLPVVFSAVAS